MLFRRPPLPSSPAASAALGFLGILLLAILIGVSVEMYAETTGWEPSWEYLILLRDFAARHTLGVAAAVGSGCVLFVIATIIIVLAANHRFRRSFKSRFLWQPSEYAPGEATPQPSEPKVP